MGFDLADLYFLSVEHACRESGRDVSGSEDFGEVLGFARATGKGRGEWVGVGGSVLCCVVLCCVVGCLEVSSQGRVVGIRVYLEAITGTLTAACTAAISGRSYPAHWPSISMQFNMISPAPRISDTYMSHTQ